MFTNDCIVANLHGYHGGDAAPKVVPKPLIDRNRWGHRALAKTALLKRDFSQAKRYFDNVATKARERKDMVAYARAMNETAFIHILMSKLDTAAIIYKLVYETWRAQRIQRNSLGFNDYMFFLWDYAVFLRNHGEFAQAQRIELKLERFTVGLPMTYVFFSRAERLADRGQFVLAEQIYEDAFMNAGLENDLNMQLRIAERLAPVYHATGKTEIAESLIEEKVRLERARCVSMFRRPVAQL
ncbi:MAG TPA: hypothetical protein V6C76_10240 [Drouetiella sp.]